MKAALKTLALAISLVTLGLVWIGASPAAAGPLPYASGIVQADGTILSGTFFTVTHTGTGQYTVTYDSATFGRTPAMSVTAFGTNGNQVVIATVFSERKAHGKVVFSILTSSTAGTFTPIDSGFQFTIVVT
jgi:hypothetical protein